MKKKFLVFCLIVFATVSVSQETYHFKKALVLPGVSRYGREAISTDQLAFRIYSKNFTPPAEGDSFGVDSRGQGLKWQAVTADSINRLRSRGGGFGGGPFGGGGYMYLTYESPRDQNALLNVKGSNSIIFNNETHAGDAYSSGWLYIPVRLKKGVNSFYVRGGNIIADLVFPKKPVLLNTEDATLPIIAPGNSNNDLMGAVVLINNSAKTLNGLIIESELESKKIKTPVPSVPPMSTRKIIFHFDGSGVTSPGKISCILRVFDKASVVDETTITIESVSAGDKYSTTFVSDIDGSLQYYAVTPQSSDTSSTAALFLSVHGAGVEAIGQARAYKPKEWGTLVAATNRRPRGFNWEDWGRLDALEVLALAKAKFKPHPQHIYLTGHSMGGHGTWFLGATYPDKWAAIAPCAGYPTLKEYGSADGLIPASSSSAVEQLLLRSSNQSDVLKLVNNYKGLGVYIFHGDADRVVPVRYARQMRKILGEFHPDLSYYEYPGGEHWFGDHSVDWKPLFDFFKWHKRGIDSSINSIDFTTANPGISSSYRWASIYQQTNPLQYSRIQLSRNRQKNTITGITENVELLKLDVTEFGGNGTLTITLDSTSTVTKELSSGIDSVFLKREQGRWVSAEDPGKTAKGPHRYGTFKDPFNHQMVFVYGTTGTREENEWSFNKARFDAETWYYRGNGAVDIITDKEYSPAKFAGRNVILFGNATTNSAYASLLADCPVKIERNSVRAGSEVWNGDDLGAYFVWPVKGSKTQTVGVIGGTGLKGMQAANPNQYFAGGSGFPDFMIFRLKMLQEGAPGIEAAGFFDNSWALQPGQIIKSK